MAETTKTATPLPIQNISGVAQIAVKIAKEKSAAKLTFSSPMAINALFLRISFSDNSKVTVISGIYRYIKSTHKAIKITATSITYIIPPRTFAIPA